MKKLFALTIVLGLLSACGINGHQVGGFSLYSDVQQTTNINEVLVRNENMKKIPVTYGTKEGKACGKNILGLAAFGDVSIETARKNGKINNVTAVSQDVKNMIVLGDICTIVRGN